jgi:hypothetical protein
VPISPDVFLYQLSGDSLALELTAKGTKYLSRAAEGGGRSLYGRSLRNTHTGDISTILTHAAGSRRLCHG